MDNRAEVREFLMTRRAHVTPADVGIPTTGTRRVAGLRRAEVAMLAGLSVEYYAKLERGALAGASAGVLDAVARALRLDDTETAHLLDLARAADGVPTSGRARRRATRPGAPRPALQWALDAITDGIAVVRNQQQDVVALNALGRAFYSPLLGEGRTPNLARFQFLDPAARDFYPDWDRFAGMCVAIMRAEAGRDPHDRGLQDLVGELSTRSEEFRRLWGAHDVREHGRRAPPLNDPHTAPAPHTAPTSGLRRCARATATGGTRSWAIPTTSTSAATPSPSGWASCAARPGGGWRAPSATRPPSTTSRSR